MTAESSSPWPWGGVDETIEVWRQGDCVLGECWFVHRLNPALALTDGGRVAAESGADLVESPVAGLVVVTQTCDIVRSSAERPYIEVCPLVSIDDDKLHDVERGRRPAYAFLPLLAEHRLVADLDRTMTIEKAVLAQWQRTPGWNTDSQARAFALALARKRVRFAFPDDFTALVDKLQSRLVQKHDRESLEGRALRALREIRVRAAPSWGSNAVTLTFWFVRRDEDFDFEGRGWASFLEAWVDLIPETGRFIKVYGQVVTLEDLTAADYVESDPLDLDHLSSRRSGESSGSI